MVEEGTVVTLMDGVAEVQIAASACCGSCAACVEAGENKRMLKAEAPPGVAVGDRVVIEFGPQHIAWSVLLVFVLPMAGLVAGVLLGQSFPWARLGKDLSSALYGFGLLGVGFAIASIVDRRRGEKAWPPPRIVGPARPASQADHQVR